MGSCQPFVDDEPFDKRVKTLADNELLEIWEETQQLEDLLRTQMQTDLAMYKIDTPLHYIAILLTDCLHYK